MNNEKALNKRVLVGPAFLKIAGSDMYGIHRGQEWEWEQCYGGGTASWVLGHSKNMPCKQLYTLLLKNK